MRKKRWSRQRIVVFAGIKCPSDCPTSRDAKRLFFEAHGIDYAVYSLQKGAAMTAMNRGMGKVSILILVFVSSLVSFTISSSAEGADPPRIRVLTPARQNQMINAIRPNLTGIQLAPWVLCKRSYQAAVQACRGSASSARDDQIRTACNEMIDPVNNPVLCCGREVLCGAARCRFTAYESLLECADLACTEGAGSEIDCGGTVVDCDEVNSDRPGTELLNAFLACPGALAFALESELLALFDAEGLSLVSDATPTDQVICILSRWLDEVFPPDRRTSCP